MASVKYNAGNPTRRHSRFTRRQFIADTGKVGLSASLLPLSAEAAAAPNEINLGAVYPLSGDFANVAVEFRNAAVMALDFINGINGVTGEVPFASDLPLAQGQGIPRLNGAKLKLLFADSQGKPQLALSDADRLITSGKCVGLFGCYTSATTITASEVAERYGIPFINPDSSSPRLTRRGFKWFVRIQPDDATFSKDFFLFLKELKAQRPDIKATKLALLHENTAFGADAAKAQLDYAKQYGYEIVADVEHPTPASNVSGIVEKLRAANPEILLQTSYFAEAALFLKTFDQL